MSVKYDKIKVKIINFNVDIYNKLGYKCKIGDIIEVDIKDCKNIDRIKTTVICDKCGKEEEILLKTIYNNNYFENEYICKSCLKEKLNNRKCEICGSTHKVTNYLGQGKLLCSKHQKQLREYGEIKRTIFDKNEIRLYDTYAEFDTYDKNGSINGTFLIDLDMIDFIEENKIFKHKDGYAVYHIKGTTKEMRLHRKIMNMENGDKSIIIDHINGKKYDNRRSNLRLVTSEQNNRNVGMYCHNTSGYKGISFDKKRNKYEAYIHNKNRKIGLGLYSTLDEAIKYREIAELMLYNKYSPRYEELNNKYLGEQYCDLKNKIKNILKKKIEDKGDKINI